MCTRQNCINRQLVITVKPRQKGNVQPQYLPKEEKKGVGKSWSAQTGLVADDLPYLCSLYHLHKIYIQISIYLYTDMYIDKYKNAQIQKYTQKNKTTQIHRQVALWKTDLMCALPLHLHNKGRLTTLLSFRLSSLVSSHVGQVFIIGRLVFRVCSAPSFQNLSFGNLEAFGLF